MGRRTARKMAKLDKDPIKHACVLRNDKDTVSLERSKGQEEKEEGGAESDGARGGRSF